jgi:tellurite resistance protein
MEWRSFLSRWRRGGDQVSEPRTPILPDIDAEEDDCGAEEFECEGQSFMIDYVDSKGTSSRRSITVLSVKYNDQGMPYLGTRCHHRKAYRTFRVDRIEACIDYDGEVHVTGPFLLDNLDLDVDARGAVSDINTSPLAAARKQARPHAILLAGLSRSDDYMHPDELGVLKMHCETLRNDLTLDECNKLGNNYHRLKPTADQMADAIEELRSEPPQLIEKFLLAANALIEVDGILDPDEIKLYDDFCVELTGVSATGVA